MHIETSILTHLNYICIDVIAYFICTYILCSPSKWYLMLSFEFWAFNSFEYLIFYNNKQIYTYWGEKPLMRFRRKSNIEWVISRFKYPHLRRNGAKWQTKRCDFIIYEWLQCDKSTSRAFFLFIFHFTMRTAVLHFYDTEMQWLPALVVIYIFSE